MPDNFTFTAADLQLISDAKTKGGDIWADKTLDTIKGRIKDHYLAKTDEQCCYCRKNFTGEFRFVIDIEHVLPKSQYPDLIFELINLSVSCKRCNMNIKREDTTFLIDPVGVVNRIRDAAQYLFSHPNLDDYFQHMSYLTQSVNSKKSIKYLPLTNKGNFTYTFFRLNQLEINTLNVAQGIAVAASDLSENIPPILVNDIEDLLAQL